MQAEQITKINNVLEAIQYPGLTREAGEIQPLAESILKHYSALAFKENISCLWISFIGGTGTGKSTLFNALLGMNLSAIGVERPKTRGPLAFEHMDCRPPGLFPFSHLQWTVLRENDPVDLPLSGLEGHVQVFTHNHENFSHLVLIDTPDLDSVEKSNRLITEDLILLSDIIVYVTSQDKYADEIPSGYLADLAQRERPIFLILNKADKRTNSEEIFQFHVQKGISLEQDHIWIIPFLEPSDTEAISDHQVFRHFRTLLLKTVSSEVRQAVMRRSLQNLTRRLERDSTRLRSLVAAEDQAAKQWLKQLNEISDRVCRDFVEEQKERFIKGKNETLGREIRKLFARYDLLAGPRKFVQGLILTPLKLLGLANPKRDQQEDFKNVRNKMDLASVQEALTRLNLLVLEKLSPVNEDSPLFQAIRRPGLILTQKEIASLILDEERKLEEWLKQTFDQLSREIPTGKKWGIYSTSIVWGILILTFETAVGGGFTLIDAVVDSALAPLMTKGAVELFAAREIRKIARELSDRYREALLSVLRMQSRRYEDCLRSVMLSDTTMVVLEKIQDRLKTHREK